MTSGTLISADALHVHQSHSFSLTTFPLLLSVLKSRRISWNFACFVLICFFIITCSFIHLFSSQTKSTLFLQDLISQLNYLGAGRLSSLRDSKTSSSSKREGQGIRLELSPDPDETQPLDNNYDPIDYTGGMRSLPDGLLQSILASRHALTLQKVPKLSFPHLTDLVNVDDNEKEKGKEKERISENQRIPKEERIPDETDGTRAQSIANFVKEQYLVLHTLIYLTLSH